MRQKTRDTTLVVVDDFRVVCVATLKAETKVPLIVDPNAVRTGSIAAKCL